MTENLYNRFVDAFRDENETSPQHKHSPLISDEKLEDTLKTIKRSFQDGVKDVKETVTSLKEEKKTSRFQRWVMYYLKAPFQKWKSPKVDTEPTTGRATEISSDDDDEEENEGIHSSSNISDSDDDDDDDDDDDEEDTEEDSTLTDRVKQRLESLQDKVKSKVCKTRNTLIEVAAFSIRSRLPMMMKKKKMRTMMKMKSLRLSKNV